jgi:hypothetical protein
MKHFVITVDPYVPGPQKIFGVADANGCLDTDEARQAFAAIDNWGNNGPHQRQYANRFFTEQSAAGGSFRQVRDAGNVVELSDDQEKAVEFGTRAPNFLMALVRPASTPAGAAAPAGLAVPPSVQLGVEGSLYNYIVHNEFQHNLNVGDDGSLTGTGAQAGT